MAARKLVEATAGFVAISDGAYRVVRAGEVLPATDPVVKANPKLFRPSTSVEQATAAPGERRKR
jgi:hypothetical protein